MSGEPGTGTVVAADFRLISLLGEGGMGRVYVAEQLSTGRKRALKLLHPTFAADAVARERFALEARVGGRIESEHVVEVIAAGVDSSSGLPWLAMELLDGEDLAARLRRDGCIPIDEVSAIMRQVGHALGAAHDAGIVHRDLKPENIFLARPRREGAPLNVKVLDFGIAKWIQEARLSATATAAMGTPFWMAPEQTEPRGRISAATDVWALGLLAFNLLTGHIYWNSARQPGGASLAVLLREIIFEPIASPSERASEIVPSLRLPQRFDAWFLRCMAREPSERFASARPAIEALMGVLAPNMAATVVSERTAIHAPPSAALAGQFPASRRAIALGGIAILGLIGGAAALARRSDETSTPSSPVELPRAPRSPDIPVVSVAPATDEPVYAYGVWIAHREMLPLLASSYAAAQRSRARDVAHSLAYGVMMDPDPDFATAVRKRHLVTGGATRNQCADLGQIDCVGDLGGAEARLACHLAPGQREMAGGGEDAYFVLQRYDPAVEPLDRRCGYLCVLTPGLEVWAEDEYLGFGPFQFQEFPCQALPAGLHHLKGKDRRGNVYRESVRLAPGERTLGFAQVQATE